METRRVFRVTHALCKNMVDRKASTITRRALLYCVLIVMSKLLLVTAESVLSVFGV